jgi:hypothetical protein
MPKCEICGREHDDKPSELYATAERRTSESLSKAGQDIGHVCAHCQCQVIGHGVTTGGRVYCCPQCALLAPANAKDRII